MGGKCFKTEPKIDIFINRVTVSGSDGCKNFTIGNRDKRPQDILHVRNSKTVHVMI